MQSLCDALDIPHLEARIDIDNGYKVSTILMWIGDDFDVDYDVGDDVGAAYDVGDYGR